MEGIALIVLGLVGAVAALAQLGRGRRPLDLRDPKDQLRAVRRAEFAPCPILNRAEMRRYGWIEAWTRDRPYRLFAQVSYGEILRSSDPDAHASINAKRADLVLVDADGVPAAVIEYQGSGHYQGNARARDAVKRAALERAGVPLVELFPHQDRRAAIAAIEAALA